MRTVRPVRSMYGTLPPCFRRTLIVGALLVGLGDAGAQNPFTEEAAQRGLLGITYGGQWVGPYGYGVALNDLDGDGDPDVIWTGDGIAGNVRVFETRPSGLEAADRTYLGEWPVDPWISGVSCADYDGDGDLDVYLSGWSVANRLLRNDGGFSFTDVTSVAGVGDTGFATGSTWADFDGDGWLDLYVCNRTGSRPTITDTTPNRLYRNRGDGTFEEVGALHGVDDPHKSYQAIFFDHDLDGDPDLYLSTDKGDGTGTNHNRLWRNDDGEFVEISNGSGTDVAIDSMGLDAGDFDGDGDFDLYCTNIPIGNKLFLKETSGNYTQSAETLGVAGYESGWSALFWDFDSDGWTDLHVANSYANNMLFAHGGALFSSDLAVLYSIHDSGASTTIPGSAYCAAVGDIDGDGDEDLLVQTWNEPFALYVNHEGNTRNWIRVRLRQPTPNVFAVGATVDVFAGGRLQRQQLRAGRGYKSSSELVLFFGLADVASVDWMRVRWPDGELTRLTGLAVDQEVLVDRAVTGSLADCDGDLVPDSDQIAADPSLDRDLDGILDACEPRFIRGDANDDGALDISDAVSALEYLFVAGSAGCVDAIDSNDDGRADVADPVRALGFLFSARPPPPPPFPDCGLDPTLDAGSDLGCESTAFCGVP